MRVLSHHQSLWLLFLGASPALAAFEEFTWAGNGGNSSALRKCGNMPYGCNPPNMCSQDTLTRKWYCCNPGTDSVCWNGLSKCDGDGTNMPSSAQLGCTMGSTKWCCLKDTERCTQVANQINICWSNLDNQLQPLNGTRMNETFLSLSSAKPSASSYTIAKAELLAMSSTSAGATPSATPTSVSASSSATATATSASNTSPIPVSSSSGLSGGAIGGIVGGVVGGLALLGLAAFFLWRRKRASTAGKVDPHAPAGDPYQNYAYQPGYAPQQPYSPHPSMSEMHAPPPTTKYAHVQQPVEAPAFRNPVEMDAGPYQPPPQQQTK